MANTQFGGGMEKREENRGKMLFSLIWFKRVKSEKKSYGPTNFGKIREKRLLLLNFTFTLQNGHPSQVSQD